MSQREPNTVRLSPPDPAARLGHRLAGALYLLLVCAAALALWTRQYPRTAPTTLDRAAPWVFLAFAVCFALYRLVLVRAGKYPAGKALFQVGTTALFFVLLLPWSQPSALNSAPVDDLPALLADSDPRVRALAAEVIRHRPDGRNYAPLLVRALSDPSEKVRVEAHRSLVELVGTDLGSPDDARAVDAWRTQFP